MENKIQARFIRGFLIAIIILLVTQLIINIIIDPFGIFNVVTIPSINKSKTEIFNNLRLSKPMAACTQMPNAIILGSSRVELGLDPEHPAFLEKGYRVYNLGLTAVRLDEILYALKHAYYASEGKLKLAVIGLDPFMFIANRSLSGVGAINKNLNSNNIKVDDYLSRAHYCEMYFLNNIDRILLNQGLIASFKTIKRQSSENVYLKNGMRDYVNDPIKRRARTAGSHTLFANHEKHIFSAWSRKNPTYIYPDGTSSFDTLREIITFSRMHDIELKLFLSPAHGRLLSLFKEGNIWKPIESLKRGIVEVLHEDTLRFPNNPITLWDFLTYNSLTTEAIPSKNKKNLETQWFWDGAHYKKSAGDLVLNKVMGQGYENLTTYPDFGIKLNKDNLESTLEEFRLQSLEFERKFPQDILEIKMLVKRDENKGE